MPKTEAVTDPRFALSLWRVSDKLLVVDSRHAELALPTEPLLANILTALGLPRTPLPKADVLRWPMYDYPLAPKGDDAARDTILAMLEGRLEMEPVEYVLLMGAEACHYVLPPELLPATAETGDDASLATARSPGLSAVDSFACALGKAVRVEPLKVTAIVVPSLCDMLQEPELKAQTWKSIQPLRQR
ncbi:hypothetical protein G8770_00880 [Aestuariicella hydrocarbonica]|uniref:Uncharacterized protein n=1 Tax=Pseudomaricurvus hydrocarbonicus TaxID=1470433 RepID=A0A9E5JRP4_9GAMM|nr:hypothetical protein [Aestuariicella hydrocarbonica]NHO64099.1 hypothetical protein [Aestuariicella hydrocarbonica]